MASLCKSQQCSIERRGFRQELDSWRYKLIHCVGFESILEGLFGPGLLKDLSLFKDCEPTGVCDWSFDENCLFCCLRREKVKEHLAGFNKSVSETGQENLRKQEKAKIIRLERQAEEFINAVFYKKDSPRISDPNIPLVAREIMQRMIRQFAAEYTSKNSSTQDSSQPNSTKNQSLPKSPSGQSSPPPATTQNPVLSKLLMADQDSPLDLTVKKPQSEETCEQADGVLDLSTKKSPCSGSTHSSISPSTSNAIGNGTQKTEGKAVDLCNSSLTLEKFMVKLCAHHQKQFLLVLNSLCTEESFMNSKSQRSSILDVKKTTAEDLNDSSNCISDQCMREKSIHSTNMETSINTAAVCADIENCSREVAQNIDILKSPVLLGIEENSVTQITFLNNCSHSASHQEENIAKNHILHFKPSEENSQLLQSDETGCTKKLEPFQTDFSECCVLSHSNLTLNPVTSSQETEFINLPKCADKENAQCISPRQSNLDKDNDSKIKQNSVHTVVVTKLGNHLNHYESFQTLNESPVSPFHKIRSHDNIRHSKTAKRCKNAPSLRKSDCDNQCDVVYISEPITAQYHFQHQKSFLYSRNTARKSTRGYLFSDESCQLSTVRTLVRSSKVEDKGNCALHFAEALIIPDSVITETLPLTDDVSLVHSEETDVGIGTVNSLPQNDIIPDPSLCKESGNTDEISSMVEQSVNAVSDSLLAVFSLVHDGNENSPFSGSHPSNEIVQKKPVDMVEQEDIPQKVSNIHEDCPEKHPFAYSSISVSEETNATPTSLDVDLVVSLEDDPIHAKEVTASHVEEASPNEFFSQKPTIEQIDNPLENASVSPLIISSVFPLSNEIAIEGMSPSPPEPSKITHESSEVMFKDLTFSPVDLSSDTVANGMTEKTFEDSSYDSLKQNLNCSNHVNNLDENITELIVKDSSSVTSPKKTEQVLEDYIEQNSDICSDHVEPTEITELKKLETAKPSEIINFSISGRHVDGISNEDVHNLLDTCAKICEPSDLKERSVTKQDTQPCHSFTSCELENNGDIEKSSQTKEINGENCNVAEVDKLDNHLPNNTNGKFPMSPKRKLKKYPHKSDRRLRSRESQTDTCRENKASLHVHISQFSSTKSPHRSVEFSTECATQYGHSMQINSHFEESLDGENFFVQFLSDQFAKEKTLLSERMFKSAISSTPKSVENVSVHFEISSNQRTVYLCSKSKNCLKVEGKENNCSPSILENDCLLKCNKQAPEDTPVSLARTRSKAKCVALNSMTDHKDKAKILEHLSIGNEKRPSKVKKSLAFTNMDISLNSSKDKETVRPKFLDWCFEEENQERIASFNNKYSFVHNNWIPLEKDMSVGPKSKNKADKLKEIWKTKKRSRKVKTVEETQSHSPMQMLFTNTFKLSDICKWFLETTETKSLVIVKKVNTRLPEEHQLPIMPSQKHSSSSLYPHTLQAERLKKHLKKFASAYPARNNAKIQNTQLDSQVQLVEPSKISDSRYSGSNKPTSARILRKYNNFREKLHPPSVQLNKHKAAPVQNSATKIDLVQNRQLPSSKLNSPTVANPPACKSVITDEKHKAKKRPKDEQSIKPVVQTSKRRKTELNQELEDRHSTLRTALPAKKTDCKVERTEAASRLQAPKRQAEKSQAGKAAISKKGKTKTAMQKESSKTQLVRKCQTRSSKRKPVPPVLSEQRITRASQSWMKEFHSKLCTGSKTASKTQLLEKRMIRSRTDSSTQSRR